MKFPGDNVSFLVETRGKPSYETSFIFKSTEGFRIRVILSGAT
jgi:hypothetical protein